jgi:hypothetical protein
LIFIDDPEGQETACKQFTRRQRKDIPLCIACEDGIATQCVFKGLRVLCIKDDRIQITFNNQQAPVVPFAPRYTNILAPDRLKFKQVRIPSLSLALPG